MQALSRAGIALGGALLIATPTALPAAAATPDDRGICVSKQGWGELCIKLDPRGYDISYYKAANPIHQVNRLDFNLDCANGRWFGDDGAFTQWSKTWRSFTFAVGNQGSCWGVLINIETGQTMETPAVG
ncbi:hypothetical protein [Wenjunlia tyrosinilytica]|uniref:Uncharacterized protein n=1 Tax=Wenjunlia tyrosinilytica TaxID=1544741 RepID=A0A917ZV05_9ACTN|nr:hypothetical protein [Wenjunlia tyrosinilytica]GGO93391.1 hypothetical protein GCM10012280_45820 [Wenjunlia tyrosinilytica]